MNEPPIRSDIAWSSSDRIVVRGLDLPSEILGHMDLGEFSFLQLTGRRPSPEEARMYNAIIVTLVEHGMTPSAIAARMTYTGAPESLQSAVAAGISGLGTVFVGSIEGSARMLSQAVPYGSEPGDLAAIADRTAQEYHDAHRLVPGIGHPLHKPIDPRTPRLFEIARETGLAGTYTELIVLIAEQFGQLTGRELPVNATGAIGAICCQFGFPWQIVRGFGVMARAIGLVGHLKEEMERPMAPAIWNQVEAEASADSRP